MNNKAKPTKTSSVLTSTVAFSAAEVERIIVAEFARRGYAVAPGTRPEMIRCPAADRTIVGAAFDRIVATVLVAPIPPKAKRKGA